MACGIISNMNRTDSRLGIEKACRLIETCEPVPALGELARQAGLSPAHFQKLFVATVGVSPKAYGDALRRKRLSSALQKSTRVTDAIYDAGYAASSAAYRDSQLLGMKPARIRQGGKQEQIRYACTQCSLGALLVAATPRGICAVDFGSKDRALDTLRTRFPEATIEPADAALAGWVGQVVALIDAATPAKDLPLDIRGTAFQTRVWRELARIPSGETVSYAELATRIRAPGSARAVARACATNSIAVVVPCHRVVRGSGELAGYRWGIERKRQLAAARGRGRACTGHPAKPG